MTKNDLKMTLNDLQMTLRPYTSLPLIYSPKMLQKLSYIRVPSSYSFHFIYEKPHFSPFLGEVGHFGPFFETFWSRLQLQGLFHPLQDRKWGK